MKEMITMMMLKVKADGRDESDKNKRQTSNSLTRTSYEFIINIICKHRTGELSEKKFEHRSDHVY